MDVSSLDLLNVAAATASAGNPAMPGNTDVMATAAVSAAIILAHWAGVTIKKINDLRWILIGFNRKPDGKW